MKKRLSELQALAQLQRVKSSFKKLINTNYEDKAVNCRSCPTPGACCTDAHWVNVRITRLEAVAIKKHLQQTPRLTSIERRNVYRKAEDAVEKYRLRAASHERQTYSCPLYDRRVGCLVHRRAKPAACIQHACYENWQDLPPQRLLTRTEHRVEQLNQSVYGEDNNWLPIPLWLTALEEEERRCRPLSETHNLSHDLNE